MRTWALRHQTVLLRWGLIVAIGLVLAEMIKQGRVW